MTTTALSSTLAQQINQEHQLATDAAKTAVHHARRCGELLLQAKAQIGHGGFLPWLAANCQVKERQARTYMRIAENWTAIEANRHRGADLTIKGAVRLLRGPNDETHKPVDLNCKAAREYDKALRAFERQACRDMPDLTDEDITRAYQKLVRMVRNGEMDICKPAPEKEKWLQRGFEKVERNYCRTFPAATDADLANDLGQAMVLFAQQKESVA